MNKKLIVFSDPGGAKPCLALARKWKADSEVLVCSDRQYAFYETFGVPVHFCSEFDAQSLFEEFAPDSLFTGTSYTSRIEIRFLQEAAKKGVRSASLVDYSTGFKQRFELDGMLVFPDEIRVLDARSVGMAEQEGLPREKIRVSGNPYHEFLRGWRSTISKQQLWKSLDLPCSEAKIILFAPDPISNAGGVSRFGTDETVILKLLLGAIGCTAGLFRLIVKAHPNQPSAYLKKAMEKSPANVDCHFVGAEHDALLNDLIQHADLVVGMFSNMLVEAELLGAKTLRILCGLNLADPLETQITGDVVVRDNDLASCLSKSLLNTKRANG